MVGAVAGSEVQGCLDGAEKLAQRQGEGDIAHLHIGAALHVGVNDIAADARAAEQSA